MVECTPDLVDLMNVTSMKAKPPIASHEWIYQPTLGSK